MPIQFFYVKLWHLTKNDNYFKPNIKNWLYKLMILFAEWVYFLKAEIIVRNRKTWMVLDLKEKK